MLGNGGSGFTLFVDANSNGILDPGELSTTSDAFGRYAFDGLAPGSYTVAILPNPGYSLLRATQTATLTATAPLSSGNDFDVQRDTGLVQVAVPPVTPTLRTTPVTGIDITLSEPVNDLQLMRTWRWPATV